MHWKPTVRHLLQDLVVRVVFILGNLTAKNNQAREQFFREKESIPTLLSLFRAFYELDLHAERPAGAGDEQPTPQKPRAQVEDVLIKLTRVLANLAIHPGVGPALAADPQVVGLLLATLGKALGPARGLWCTQAAAPCSRDSSVGWVCAGFYLYSQLAFFFFSQPRGRKFLFCSEMPQR